MKATFNNWFRDKETDEVLLQVGYSHNETIDMPDEDVFKIVRDLFDNGANVVLIRDKQGEDHFIGVSAKYSGFGMR
jgi:hypothetical protein